MIAITPAVPRPVRKKNRNRHRPSVRALRTILPTIALGTAVAIIGQGAIRAMAIKPAAPAAAAPLRMDNPRFTGTLKDGRAFLITATSATRDLNNADQVFLKNPQLTRGYGSEAPTHVISKDGAYQEEKGSLLLTGDVKVDNGQGYQFASQKALIDTHTGDLVGGAAVEGAGPNNGAVRADDYSVSDKGDRVLFKGRVRTRLTPNQ
ncbi:LPS export ABC transporter periplasmic protein LptC [Caulobacter soli]|uniref:LPS export ABC transporter periplasmic protein LptC n=1 Tax=Caulobacter soli TaxID=2708539 RepID=UPI0013EDA748|nr:LPS export ABC transporter periplasmic protein LptC [Caulobacter soli]